MPEPKTTLWTAMLAAQKEAPILQRSAINPHFKSKFVSLDVLLHEVLPVLNDNGLVLTQMPTVLDGLPALRTCITHAPTGEQIEETMLLMLTKDDPQGQGSGITYARRYSLMAMLGMLADVDDDAEAAQRKSRAPEAAVSPLGKRDVQRRPDAPATPSKILERLTFADPTVAWSDTIGLIVAAWYGGTFGSVASLPVEERPFFLTRLANFASILSETATTDGDFPPPTVGDFQAAVAQAFEGVTTLAPVRTGGAVTPSAEPEAEAAQAAVPTAEEAEVTAQELLDGLPALPDYLEQS